MGYQQLYDESINDPIGFWDKAAKDIIWDKPYQKVLDDSNKPFYRWFSGGELNTCYNAIDYHVENGRANQTAIIYDSPVTNTIRRISYKELLDEVSRFAGVLRSFGVGKGDRVIIYLPMTPEALIAMYACARIGAIHSVVFGGFASHELAIRIDDAEPKLIISASCGIEVKRIVDYKTLLDEAIDQANHKVDKCIIYQRSQHICHLKEGRDFDWYKLMETAKSVDCVSVKASDPLYILYTSGTTGIPKGIVRDNGGHAVALKWSMRYIYDVSPGDVYWAASDVGWVVGHSYIVYAPLLYGCTTVVYEGKPVGTPDAGAFYRVIQDHNVKVLFTAPTAFRAIKKEDPNGEHLKRYNISGFKYLFLAGERLDPDTYYWACNLLKVPVIDHWWQTETGWAIVANCMGVESLDQKAGSSTKAVPGYKVEVVDEKGEVCSPDAEGSVTIKLPLPPGALLSLWNNDRRYKESYLDTNPGRYTTGDGGFIDNDDYVFIMGRTDDVIIVAGHNLSTGSLEEVIASHPDIAECAVIGASDKLKTQLPLGLVVLKAGVKKDHAIIIKELVQLVRHKIGPVANFKQCIIVNRLPKTRSGKILRAVMRKIADQKDYNIPSTIEDPVVLDEIAEGLLSIGYGKK